MNLKTIFFIIYIYFYRNFFNQITRVWDVNTRSEIQSLKFANAPNSIELSRDGQMFVLTQGKCVEFYDSNR